MPIAFTPPVSGPFSFPATQKSHVNAPGYAYLSATQSVQTVSPVAPEYFPAGQTMHTGAPAAEYLPAKQLVQLPEPI